MRTKILHGWKWALAVTSAMALLGCLDEPKSSSAQNVAAEASVNTPPPAPENVVQEEILPAKEVVPPAQLSPAIAEVVKLAQSGVGDEVLLAYIDKSNRAFNPSVEEIVYLKDLGLSEPVLASLVRQKNVDTSATAQVVPPAENKISEQSPAPTNLPSLIDSNQNAPVAGNELQEAPLTPPQQIDANYFENTLSPYGSWVEVPDYGRCWQPTVVVINHDWRPYADRGRWVYTTCGWYWQSDYSWGWAPFHYGRWFCDSRIGWCWKPDSIWGPSWVSWRYSNDYCGWAPLPPSARFDGGGFRFHNAHVGINFDFGLRADFYTFLPIGRLCDRSPHHYYVSDHQRRTTVYNNTVVINNYVKGHNNTVINEGVGRDRVSKASRTPIRTVALRDLPASSSAIGRADRIEGNSLTVFRPNVAASHTTTHSATRQPAETTRPSRTSLISSSPKTETTRSGISPSRIETVRAPQPKTEATAPVVAPNVPATSPQIQSTRRLGAPSTSITRSSPQIRSQKPDRVQPSTETHSTQSAIENRSNHTRTGSTTLRQLPTAQNSAQNPSPVQRNTPSIIENPRQREAAVIPQPSIQNESINSSRIEARRNYERPQTIDPSVPRSLRSVENQRQQQSVFSAPGNVNRGSSVERSSVGRSSEILQSPRSQEAPAQRAQPAQRGSDHSDRSNHDKKK